MISLMTPACAFECFSNLWRQRCSLPYSRIDSMQVPRREQRLVSFFSLGILRKLLLISFLVWPLRALRRPTRVSTFANMGLRISAPFLRRPWKLLDKRKNDEANKRHRVHLSSGIDRVRLSDDAILQNLKLQHGWCCKDRGGGGDCLFLSIAPQISCSDVMDVYSRSEAWANALRDVDIGESWKTLPAKAQASLLRRIAILDERDFVLDLRRIVLNGNLAPPNMHWRAVELFKDMAEEFMTRGQTELANGLPVFGNLRKSRFKRIRDLVRDLPSDAMYEYIFKHADDYMQITGREGNWAGSSEMAALAHALRRKFCAYGDDLASSDDGIAIQTFEDGAQKVLPYFEVEAPLGCTKDMPPVRVFQRSGGGHYQQLG